MGYSGITYILALYTSKTDTKRDKHGKENGTKPPYLLTIAFAMVRTRFFTMMARLGPTSTQTREICIFMACMRHQIVSDTESTKADAKPHLFLSRKAAGCVFLCITTGWRKWWQTRITSLEGLFIGGRICFLMITILSEQMMTNSC